MKHLNWRNRNKPVVALIAVVLACWSVGSVQAVQLDTGPDWRVNLDNTVQYTIGVRAKDIDPNIGNHLFFNQGDYKFPDKGDIVTNRIQDLIEFQGVYKGKQGFRVSGSVWKDFAYDDDAEINPAYEGFGFNAYTNGKYSDYTSNFFEQGAELLDLFVFYNTEIAGRPVYTKLGRFTEYWGNAFFFGFSNIAYSQHPIDYIKGFSQPGSEVKELFLPRTQVSFTAELTPELSISAQHFFEYRPNRYPEGGTYLGFFDILFDGPDTAGAAGIPTDGLVEPDHNNDNFSVRVSWAPEWAGGDLGFYYRKFDEVDPWAAILNPTTFNMQNTFAEGVTLWGVSYERTFGLISTAFELNQRRDTALNSAPFIPTNKGASGTITNFIANTFIQLGKTAIWDTGILLAEISYTHLDDVTGNKTLYNGKGTANCVNPVTGGPGGVQDGCSTDDALAFAMLFSPQWLQVFPGIDFELPISVTMGLDGNPAYRAGAFYAEDSRIASIGLKAIYRSNSSITLQYNDYYWNPGPSAVNPIGLPAYAGFGGNGPVSLNDRGWWMLQFKTSF